MLLDRNQRTGLAVGFGLGAVVGAFLLWGGWHAGEAYEGADMLSTMLSLPTILVLPIDNGATNWWWQIPLGPAVNWAVIGLGIGTLRRGWQAWRARRAV